MLRVLFCGGGSVGHLAPSVAVWEEIREIDPQARSLFVCSTKRSDRAFLKQHALDIQMISAPKLSLSPSLLLAPFLFPLSLIQAFAILLGFHPSVIFAKGGHVSVPFGIASWMLRIPLVIHESDIVLGRANRFLLRFGRHLCIGTPRKELLDDAVIARSGIPFTATGNPLRRTVLRGARERGMHFTGFSGKRPVLLVMGGSQGAEVLNAFVRESIDALLSICDVIHITGEGKKGAPITHARYWKREFVTEELPHLLALADIVVSRAGAGSIAELSVHGRATILIPLRGLAHDHQEENARFLVKADAAIVLPQAAMNEELLPTIRSLAGDPDRRSELGDRLRAFANPDAAVRIAKILSEVAKKR